MGVPDFEVDLFTAPMRGGEFHDLMARARQAGPVVTVRFGGSRAYLLTRYDVLRGFLGDQAQFPGEVVYQFSTRPNIGSTLIDAPEPTHTTWRQLAMPAFRSRAVSRFVDDALTPLAHEVLDRFEAGSIKQGDLAAGVAQVLPFWAISRKLGLPVGTEERQRAWALAMLSYPSDPAGAEAAVDEVTKFLGPTIAARREEPADDVISRVLAGEYRGVRLNDAEVASHVRLLYAVGATTTSDALSSLLWRVATDPGLVERARSGGDEPARIVHESLRTEPPVAVLPRLAPSGGEVAGVELPPMALVLCGIAAANRDPAVFADPDRFDPDRSEAEILTFGFGAKYCPGTHLARQQLAVALQAVVDRFEHLRAVGTTAPEHGVLRRVERLDVRWD